VVCEYLFIKLFFHNIDECNEELISNDNDFDDNNLSRLVSIHFSNAIIL